MEGEKGVGKIIISEMFISVQGEGPQIGMISWFIRTSGCNLSCDYCDSKYAKDGTEMTIKDIVDAVYYSPCKNVVITGGEPFIQKDLLKLIKALGDARIYVETNGTIYDPQLIGYAQFIVSPKPQFMNDKYMESLKKWKTHGTFKFVVGNREEFDIAKDLAIKLGLHKGYTNVYFMPKGTDGDTINDIMISLVEWCKEEPWIRISTRLQIQLYGNKRGV